MQMQTAAAGDMCERWRALVVMQAKGRKNVCLRLAARLFAVLRSPLAFFFDRRRVYTMQRRSLGGRQR